jgi:hypothetical protein
LRRVGSKADVSILQIIVPLKRGVELGAFNDATLIMKASMLTHAGFLIFLVELLETRVRMSHSS